KKSSKFIDTPLTSVEFVTSILAATPCSSHPTWGIEDVPSWTYPISSSNKESTQRTIDKGFIKQGYDYLPWTDPETVLVSTIFQFKFFLFRKKVKNLLMNIGLIVSC
nr:mitochondrial fission 1 protein A [Tanacetum cinerariifolium]